MNNPIQKKWAKDISAREEMQILPCGIFNSYL